MGQHPTHQMHDNSLRAYASASALLRGRKLQVIEALLAVGRPMTDREIAAHYGKTRDMYQPRCSDLIEDHILYEYDKVECPVTGHEVRRLWFTEAHQPAVVS